MYNALTIDSVTKNYTGWKGFKIVGDNLDKNFRRTFQRIDYQTVSHHYFHMYAVMDRVDLRASSDLPPPGVIDVPKLVPSKDDELEMKRIFAILISRYIGNVVGEILSFV